MILETEIDVGNNERRDNELFTARPPPGTEAADVYSASTVASQAPADLLDLVRSAEEAATLATGRATPSSASKFHAASPAAGTAPRAERSSDPGGRGDRASDPGRISRPGANGEEEFVDVGDEAIDAPPSLPPMRTATPHHSSKPLPLDTLDKGTVPPPRMTRKTTTSGVSASSTKAERRPVTDEPAPKTLPPAVGILLMLALTVGALFLVTR